jgi:hypothetical protein
MKNIFILAFLFFGISQNLVAETANCTKEAVPLKMKNFSGYTENELKIEKQVAKLTAPSADQESTFDKSFEIGKYRFVRNSDRWDIYRKNNDGKFELKKVTGKFLVDADQSIWATLREDGTINIHRNVVGDQYQNEFNVRFTKKQISIKSLQGKELLIYNNCSAENSYSKPASAVQKSSTGK